MKKLVEDLESKYEGAHIHIGVYRGTFVSVSRNGTPFAMVVLKAANGMRVTVAARLQSTIELTPLPDVSVGDEVIRTAFFARESQHYHVLRVGEVTKVTKDSRGRVVYEVVWAGNLDASYHVRPMLQKLDQETKDAIRAILTEQEEQNA